MQRIAGYVGGSGLAGNPNDLALMLNLLIPITGALFVIATQPLATGVAALALLLSVAAVIATFSRAGFITLAVIGVVALVAIVPATERLPARRSSILSRAVAPPSCCPPGYFDRLGTITNIEADATGSAQGRWERLRERRSNSSRSNPITGAGLGQDILALNESAGATWRSVHNVYLQAAVDLGLPGLALFAGSAVRQLRERAAVSGARPPSATALRDLGVWPAACRSRWSPLPSRRSFTRWHTSSISSASAGLAVRCSINALPRRGTGRQS